MKTLRWLAAALLALGILHSAAPVRAEGGAKRYIVGFKAGVSQAERRSALQAMGIKAVDSLDEFDALVGEVPGDRFTSMSEAAAAQPSVALVEEDVEIDWLRGVDVAQGAQLPSWRQVREAIPVFRSVEAPKYPLPAGVEAAEVPWGIARVNAPNAWAKSKGEGVRVAVVDTGVDLSHPDLKANIAGGYNALDSKAPPQDDNKHGTHVAGTIAAVLDGKGVVGVAPKARLYAVKVLNKEGRASLTSIIKGLVWCAKNNMQVANMSLGAPIGSVFMHMAVNYAADHGVVIVAAAGNNGHRVEYPGGYADVIAVAASDVNDKIADFSSRGSKVEFIAPGVNVRSSVPGGGYESFSGTSMATPHVTGLAALAISRGASGLEGVRASLRRASSSIGLSRNEEGSGLVNAASIAR